MKKYRLLSFLLLFSLLISCMVPAASAENETAESTAEASAASETAEGVTEPETQAWEQPLSEEPLTAGGLLDYNYTSDFQIQAKAAALIELSTDTLIYGYEIDKQIYPASLTKIMTCILAIEHGNLDDVLTVSGTALQNLSEFGSTAGLKEGEEIALRELLYCIMVSSANEGCNVVAEYVSGDIATFVALMNQKAQELGMTGTHYANTHGLHDEDHYTTVRDLSILARYAWKNEQFREFATCTAHTVPATNLSDQRTLHTTNYLTSTVVEDKYYYNKASGIKTGFTTPAGSCLISTAKDGKLELLSVVCGCTSDADGTSDDMRFVETKRLFEYGFENFSYRQVLTDTTMLDQPAVLYADGRPNVVVRAKGNASVLLPNDCAPEEVTIDLVYDNAQLEAPLAEGERVGTVRAMYHGKTLVSCDLVTLTAVERSAPKYAESQTKEAVAKVGSGILRYWYLTVPLLLVLLLVIVLLIVRAVNVRRAKKRAEQRRRNAARRRRNV